MGVLLVLFILFLTVFASAQSNIGEAVGEKLSDVGRNPGKYAEIVGVYLLKFQEFLLGALSFVSLGVFGEGGTFAFAQFLFMILVFMVVYSAISVFSDKYVFSVSILLTMIGFFTVDVEQIQFFLVGYEALGMIASVFLPILILLAFTFRMYQKAYEGKSEKSPFYAEMFNLVFLIFFGVFFIRYSGSEEGIISVARYWSGWILIGLGIAQTFVYRMLAELYRRFKKDPYQLGKDLAKIKQEYDRKGKGIEAAVGENDSGTPFSYSEGMRRGGEGKKSGKFVKKASTERYAKRFGSGAAKKRFG